MLMLMVMDSVILKNAKNKWRIEKCITLNIEMKLFVVFLPEIGTSAKDNASFVFMASFSLTDVICVKF